MLQCPPAAAAATPSRPTAGRSARRSSRRTRPSGSRNAMPGGLQAVRGLGLGRDCRPGSEAPVPKRPPRQQRYPCPGTAAEGAPNLPGRRGRTAGQGRRGASTSPGGPGRPTEAIRPERGGRQGCQRGQVWQIRQDVDLLRQSDEPVRGGAAGEANGVHARGGGTTMDVWRACLPPDLHVIKAGEAESAKIKSEEKTEGAEEGAEKKRRKRQWDDSGAGNTGTGTSTGTGTTAGSFTPPPNTESITLSCPQQMVGRIIGRLGTTIKDIQAKSRCRVEVRQQQSSRQSRCSGAGAGAGDNDGQRQPQSKPGEALVTIGGERVTSQGKWRRMLSFKLEIRVRVRRNLRVRVRVVVKTEPSSNGRRQPAARLPLRAMPLQLVLLLAVALAVALAVRFSQIQSESVLLQSARQAPHLDQQKSRINPNVDINDPCCPSADGYADYCDKEQIIPRCSAAAEVTAAEACQEKENQQASSEGCRGRIVASACGSVVLQGHRVATSRVHSQATRRAGFFPPTTPMRNVEEGVFVPLTSVDLSAPLRSPLVTQGRANI